MRRSRIVLGLGAALLAGAAWSSVVTIGSGQQGVIERFGRAERDLLPGLHLKLPWPIEGVRKTSGSQVSLRMPIGYRYIDEAAGLKPTARMKNWLTGDSNIVELQANVLYRVKDVRAWLYGVSGVTNDASEVESREFALRRLAESALTDLASEVPVDELLTGGTIVLAHEARTMVQEGADRLGLGVEINSIEILKSDPLASVEQEFRNVTLAVTNAEKALQSARNAKTNTISLAKNDARRRLQEAEDLAQREIRDATARAEAFTELAHDVPSVDSLAGRKLHLDGIVKILSDARIEIVAPGTPERPSTYFLPRD